MFLARKHTASALTEIGSYFGRRSHSTVITAQKKVATWMDQQETINLANASWEVNEAIRRVEDLLRVG
jgi:chromosomal replication initiator protein